MSGVRACVHCACYFRSARAPVAMAYFYFWILVSVHYTRRVLYMQSLCVHCTECAYEINVYLFA